jgi:HEAT repeat protein
MLTVFVEEGRWERNEVSRALEAIANIGTDRAIERLVQLTEDSSWTVSPQAVSLLGRFSDDRALAALAKALRSAVFSSWHGGWILAGPAARALSRMGTPEAVQVLLDAAGEPNCPARGEICLQLANTGDARTIEAIVPVLHNRGLEAEERARAAWALAEVKDARAVASLGAILRDDADDWSVRAAAGAPGRIGGTGAIEQLAPLREDFELGDKVQEALAAAKRS